MATTKAQQRAVHAYVRRNYDRIDVTVPKGTKDRIRAVSGEKSMNQFINEAIEEKIKKEGRE